MSLSPSYYQQRAADLMAPFKRRPAIILTSTLLGLALVWFWVAPSYSATPLSPHDYQQEILGDSKGFDGKWNYKRDRNNLHLNSQQCEQAFPGLYEEINRPKKDRQSRRISREELDSIVPRNGYIRAMIYDQQLYIIQKEGNIYSRELATLHAIYRALLTSPKPVPNIEFAFNSDDRIESVALWGYARRDEDANIWLIPDFGYWSWPETKVGTMREVQMKAEEADWSWQHKKPQILWRGALMGLALREKLVEVTRDKPWADVKPLDWRNKETLAKDLKSMSDHCEYKYLAHTEGNSYSGRLKYLQSCRSVIVAHKMDWIQHHHPLMQSSGKNRNFVEVRRDYSDLEDTIRYLIKHDSEASQIAENNVKTFRERYLTPAAEACYWRKLFDAWSEVSFKPEFYKEIDGKKVWRGLPAESFFLERRLHWDPY